MYCFGSVHGCRADLLTKSFCSRTLLLVNQKQPADASSLITQILANTKYKAALGRQNLKHLRVLRGIITTNPAPSDVINQDNVTGSTTGSDQDKNLRITSSERFPVRLLCSMDLLGQVRDDRILFMTLTNSKF